MKQSAFLVSLVCLLVAVGASASTGLDNAPWPVVFGDKQLTGTYSGAVTGGVLPYVRWSVWDDGFGYWNSALVDADDNIYVVANDPVDPIRKFDKDGNLLWAFSINSWGSDTTGCLGNGGYWYLPHTRDAGGDWLLKIDTATGNIIWTYAFAAGVGVTPSAANMDDDGDIYVRTTDGILRKITDLGLSANEAWATAVNTGNPVYHIYQTGISPDDSTVYQYSGTPTFGLVALQASDGTVLWSTPVGSAGNQSDPENIPFAPDRFGQPIVDDNGDVYIYVQHLALVDPNDPNEVNLCGVNKLDGSTGAILWTFSTGTYDYQWDAGASGALSADQARLYLAGRNGGRTYSIETATGYAQWTFNVWDMDQSNGAVIVDAAGQVMACGGFGGWCFNLTDNGTTATQNWKLDLPTSDAYIMYGAMTSEGELVFTTHAPGWAEGNYIAVLYANNPPLAIITPETMGPLDEQIPIVGPNGLGYEMGAKGSQGPVTYSISAGSLPSGVYLTADGYVRGAPDPGTAGSTYNVTIQAADTVTTATKAYAIDVVAGPLQIWGLNPGVIGKPFTGGLGIVGGTPPYTVTVNKGSLPGTLTLNADGTITGTPTAVGEYALEITVTDSTPSFLVLTTDITVSVQDPRVWANFQNTKRRSGLALVSGADEFNPVWRSAVRYQVIDQVMLDNNLIFATQGHYGRIPLSIGDITQPGNERFMPGTFYCRSPFYTVMLFPAPVWYMDFSYTMFCIDATDGSAVWYGEEGAPGVEAPWLFGGHPTFPVTLGVAGEGDAADLLFKGGGDWDQKMLYGIRKTDGAIIWTRPQNGAIEYSNPQPGVICWSANNLLQFYGDGVAWPHDFALYDGGNGTLNWLSGDTVFAGSEVNSYDPNVVYKLADEGEVVPFHSDWADRAVRAVYMDPTETAKILWTLNTSDDLAPLADAWLTVDLQNNIYWASKADPAKIVSLDGQTGTVRWVYNLAPSERCFGEGAMSFDGKTFYLATWGQRGLKLAGMEGPNPLMASWPLGNPSYLYAFNTINGSVRWRLPLEAYGDNAEGQGSPVICDIDGKLYFRSWGRDYMVWGNPGQNWGAGRWVPEDPVGSGLAGEFATNPLIRLPKSWCVRDDGTSATVLWSFNQDSRAHYNNNGRSFTIGPGNASYVDTFQNLSDLTAADGLWWSTDPKGLAPAPVYYTPNFTPFTPDPGLPGYAGSYWRFSPHGYGLFKLVSTARPDITDIYWDQVAKNVVIKFTGRSGDSYDLEAAEADAYDDSLSWSTLTTVTAASEVTVTDNLTANPLTKKFRFYRIKDATDTYYSAQTVAVFEKTLTISPATNFICTPLIPDPDHDSVREVFGERIAGVDKRQVPSTGFQVSDLNEATGVVSRMRLTTVAGDSVFVVQPAPGAAEFNVQAGIGYEVVMAGLVNRKVRLTGYVPDEPLLVDIQKLTSQAERWMAYSMPRDTTLNDLGLPQAVTTWRTGNRVRLLQPGSAAWGAYGYKATPLPAFWYKVGAPTVPVNPPIPAGMGIVFIRADLVVPTPADKLPEVPWYMRPPNDW